MRDLVTASLRCRTLMHQLEQKLNAIDTLQSQNDTLIDRLMDEYHPMSNTLNIFKEYLDVLKQQLETSSVEPDLTIDQWDVHHLHYDQPVQPTLPYALVDEYKQHIKDVSDEITMVQNVFDDMNESSIYQQINELQKDIDQFDDELNQYKQKIQQNIEQSMVTLEALKLTVNYIQYQSAHRVEQYQSIRMAIDYVVSQLSLIPYPLKSTVFKADDYLTTDEWRKELDKMEYQFSQADNLGSNDVAYETSDFSPKSNSEIIAPDTTAIETSDTSIYEVKSSPIEKTKSNRSFFGLFTGGDAHAK